MCVKALDQIRPRTNSASSRGIERHTLTSVQIDRFAATAAVRDTAPHSPTICCTRRRTGGTGRDALGYPDVVSGHSLADILCAVGAAQERSQAISTVVSIAPAAGVKSTPDPSVCAGAPS
jgi:hypothetical protein